MPEPIMFPDYSGSGLINLMQSIASACGGAVRHYPELRALPAKRLSEARHIVLLVADGLGQKMLDTLPGAHNLRRQHLSTMSSVFPSTTASAIPSFMSGLAPAGHGLTGWHMYFSEIGQTLAVLPMSRRAEASGTRPPTPPSELFDYPTLYQQLDRESWVLAPRTIAGSPFNAWHSRGAQTIAYSGLAELFGQLAGLLKEAVQPRLIYAYYPDLDTLAHRFGCTSMPLQKALAAFDHAFASFVGENQGCNTWLLVTADHGFIDSPPARVISLDDHPALAVLLRRPLCGERRAAYAYVEAAQHAAFEAYINQHLSHAVDLRRSRELIEAGLFGPHPVHPRLSERVGDFTLLMRENWTIKDWLPGEKHYRMLGVHGGISCDEMLIPLMAARL